MPPAAGRLVGIAARVKRGAPMLERAGGRITLAAGLEGDFKGGKYPRRQITVLSRESWEAALAEIARSRPWTVRRANLLVEGVHLPRAAGGILRIGQVRLEVTGQTYPCARMNEAFPGLLSALAKDWRGGVTALVLEGGVIAVGNAVEVLASPPEWKPRLPG